MKYIIFLILFNLGIPSFGANTEELVKIIDIILLHEGEPTVKKSYEYSKFGIRNFLLKEYNKDQNKSYDIETLTREQATEISLYLLRLYRLDEVKDFNLRLILFDTYFNNGYGNATKIAQRAINLYHQHTAEPIEIDAVLGGHTLGLLNDVSDTPRLYNIILQLKMKEYQRHPHWKRYGRGWTKRVKFYENLITNTHVLNMEY